MEFPFRHQDDASFLLCTMIEETSASDCAHFGVQLSEISTCFICRKQEKIKVNAVDNVIILPIVINAMKCELIDIAFGKEILESEMKQPMCACGEVSKKGHGKAIQMLPTVLVTMLKQCSASDGKEQNHLSPIFISTLVYLYEQSNKVSIDSTVINNCSEKKQHDRECSMYILRAVIAHHGSSIEVGH